MIFIVLALEGVCNPSLSIHQQINSPPGLQSAEAKLIKKINQFYSLLLLAGPTSFSSGFKHGSLNVKCTQVPRSWLEPNANNATVVGPIPVWVIHFRVALDDPCESFPTQSFPPLILWNVIYPNRKPRLTWEEGTWAVWQAGEACKEVPIIPEEVWLFWKDGQKACTRTVIPPSTGKRSFRN